MEYPTKIMNIANVTLRSQSDWIKRQKNLINTSHQKRTISATPVFIEHSKEELTIPRPSIWVATKLTFAEYVKKNAENAKTVTAVTKVRPNIEGLLL